MVRLASAALVIAVVVAIVWWLPVWVALLAAAGVAAAAAVEVGGLSARTGARVAPLFLAAAAAFVTLAFAVDSATVAAGLPVLHITLVGLVVAAGLLSLATGLDAGTLQRAAVALMAPLYTGLPLGAIASIRATDGAPGVFALLVIVAVSDSAQYYIGRRFGRRKLAPVISPGKTLEGALGGLGAAAIVAAAAGPRLLVPIDLPVVVLAGIGILVAVSGIAGDLFESLLKRGAGVKDSSALIPGHGGVLDRIDSYLFAAPVFYFVLRAVS